MLQTFLIFHLNFILLNYNIYKKITFFSLEYPLLQTQNNNKNNNSNKNIDNFVLSTLCKVTQAHPTVQKWKFIIAQYKAIVSSFGTRKKTTCSN